MSSIAGAVGEGTAAAVTLTVIAAGKRAYGNHQAHRDRQNRQTDGKGNDRNGRKS